jgi:DNA gyrase subunit A
MTLGVKELLNEWIAFRIECIRRRTYFDLNKKKDKLHLLEGLKLILLDIDKAIRIVRETDEEAEVVPNLMIGFGIDKIQAEYVAEIKLRHLNREYILKRTDEIEQLIKDIEDLEGILASKARVKTIIVRELKEVADKYGKDRLCPLLHVDDIVSDVNIEEEIPDYPVNLFFTKEGYFKKITPQSLRMSSEQKLKEDDAVVQVVETTNNSDLLFFSDRCQVYKAKVSDFGDTKASVFGEYIPAKLQMDEGESAVWMLNTKDYSGYLIFAFENGKVAKVDLKAYETKTNRKKLLNAYSDKSPLAGVAYCSEDREFVLTSSAGRMLLLHSGAIAVKTTKNTQGVAVMKLKKGHRVLAIEPYEEGRFSKPSRYRTRSLPAVGALPSQEDEATQLSII